MKLDLFPLSPEDEARAWAMMHRHLIQSTLHNEILRKIEGLRDGFESATTPEAFLDLQAQIKAHRFLLGLIHRKDPLPTK